MRTKRRGGAHACDLETAGRNFLANSCGCETGGRGLAASGASGPWKGVSVPNSSLAGHARKQFCDSWLASTGKHRWRTEGFMQISDGRRIASEGEMDLASRSWKGTLFEMS